MMVAQRQRPQNRAVHILLLLNGARALPVAPDDLTPRA
jgi:hypothetical protein